MTQMKDNIFQFAVITMIFVTSRSRYIDRLWSLDSMYLLHLQFIRIIFFWVLTFNYCIQKLAFCVFCLTFEHRCVFMFSLINCIQQDISTNFLWFSFLLKLLFFIKELIKNYFCRPFSTAYSFNHLSSLSRIILEQKITSLITFYLNKHLKYYF